MNRRIGLILSIICALALAAPAAASAQYSGPSTGASASYWQFPFFHGFFGAFLKGFEAKKTGFKANLENNEDVRTEMLSANAGAEASGTVRTVGISSFPAERSALADLLSARLGAIERSDAQLSDFVASSTAEGRDLSTTTSLLAEASFDDAAAHSAIENLADLQPSASDIARGSVPAQEIAPVFQEAAAAVEAVRADLESAVGSAKSVVKAQ